MSGISREKVEVDLELGAKVNELLGEVGMMPIEDEEDTFILTKCFRTSLRNKDMLEPVLTLFIVRPPVRGKSHTIISNEPSGT